MCINARLQITIGYYLQLFLIYIFINHFALCETKISLHLEYSIFIDIDDNNTFIDINCNNT